MTYPVRLDLHYDHNLSSASCIITRGILLNSMALLDILEFPDARLRKKAKSITNVDGKIISLAEQMLETMYQAPGIGLAATQVDVHLQLLVADISEDAHQLLARGRALGIHQLVDPSSLLRILLARKDLPETDVRPNVLQRFHDKVRPFRT